MKYVCSQRMNFRLGASARAGVTSATVPKIHPRSLSPSIIFWLFTLLHVTLWTAMPALVRFTLPLDVLEGITWGQHLQWGYDKDPFLNAWLTELAKTFGGRSDCSFYLLSQLSVALCFWAVWRFGCKIMPPLYALLGVFLLEGVQYFNIGAIDFNDNVLQLGLWALAIYTFYLALTEDKFWQWAGCAVAAGLAMMTKYYTVVLLVSMLLFILVNKTARQALGSWKIYVACFIGVGVMLPHCIWLYQHDFLTIRYGLLRTGQEGTHSYWQDGFWFAYKQILTFLPAIGLFFLLFLFRAREDRALAFSNSVTPFAKAFLLSMAFLPLLVTMCVAFFAGARLHQMWGTPLLSLWGLVLIGLTQPTMTQKRVHGFMFLLLFLMGVLAFAYHQSVENAGDTSSANYPGQIVADQIRQRWKKQFHDRPLSFVAGSRWSSGIISHYLPERPSAYINWDHKISTWVDEKVLRQKGGVFVWEPKEYTLTYIDKVIKTRFPKMQKPFFLEFQWQRAQKIKNTTTPIMLGVAFLPPSSFGQAN